MNTDRFSQFEYSEDIENEIWKECVIAFDTSALLGFYYYSVDTQEKIFSNILYRVRNRLWLPNHVEFEYLKNRKTSINKPITEKYEEIINTHVPNLVKDISSIKNKIIDLNQKTSKKDTHPFVQSELFTPIMETIESLTKVADDFSKAISSEIKQRTVEIAAFESKDVVLENINKNFSVGDPYSFSKQIDILKDSELRFTNEIPPGYRDAIGKDKKNGIQKIGDLIIWYQIIDHACNTKLPIILITNDVKDDWCYISKRSNEVRIDRPREELIQEIWDKAKVKFWMYSFPQFLYTAQRILGFKIDQAVLSEADVEAINRLEEINPTLKFDGLYIFQPKNADYYQLLRFYKDGIVVSVSVSDSNMNNYKLKKISRWFNQNWNNKGAYSIYGNKISFFTKSDIGQVDYEGVIEKNSVVLNVLSHINGNATEKNKYVYYPI